jgi:hypothetical protein
MRAALLLALVAAPAFAPAFAQAPPPSGSLYRDGQPAVLTPPPVVRVDRSAAFRSRYQALKSPTMMLLWNRRLSDEVQSEYVDRGTITRSSEGVALGSSNSTAVAGYGIAARSSNSAGYAAGTSTTDVTVGRTRLREVQPGANLDAEDDAAVETAFTERLQAAGVRFVDRSIAMRTAGAKTDVSGDANIQTLETKALMARTAVLIEVRQIVASDSPIGTKFRIEVKNLKTAAVLASFTSNGVPDMGRPGLVAGPGGFQRAAPQRPTPAMIGAQLANEVMERLASTLQ